MPGSAVFQERLEKVVSSLQKTEMDALLLNRLGNIAYLTGAVNSCSWVFITREGRRVALVLDSDARVYREESAIEDIRSFRIHDPFPLFKSVMEDLGLTHSQLGLELSRPGLPQHIFRMLRSAFPSSVQFVNGETIIEEIRAVKSKEEIEAIREAVKITELGMEVAIKTIEPGVKESEVVLEAEYAMRKAGGRIPVLSYVASGKRSCLAHHVPSNKIIEKGDVVTLDIHGGYLGYCADLGRTVACGKIDREVEEAYKYLVRAEEETLGMCRKGIPMVEIKKTFYRKLSEAKGFQFLLGPVIHGVGIMNSEMPYFMFPYQDKGYPEILETDMVVAVSNIGLYSGQGWGVRVEDTVLVTENEPVYLTRFPKALVIK
jgi:Xaa-Pro dipeptidase